MRASTFGTLLFAFDSKVNSTWDAGAMIDVQRLTIEEDELLDSYLLDLAANYAAAEPLLRRKIHFAERAENPNVSLCAMLYLNLGRVCLYQNRTLDALDCFKCALDFARTSNDPQTRDYVRRYRLMFEMTA